MWPPAHAAIGYLAYSFWSRHGGQTPSSGGVVLVVFGSLFPDLVDKPLAWWVGVLPAGRSLAHSLVFVLPVTAVVLVVAIKLQRLEYGVAFTLGYALHLPADVLGRFLVRGEVSAEFLLWPLLSLPGETGGSLTYELVPDGALPELFGSVWIAYAGVELLLVCWALVQYRFDGYPGLATVRAGARFGYS